MNALACAIYTRKSSEEGLGQDFNSLDAQREACEAFIVSQKAQGWKASACYDDGGFSGGNVDRPGLQRLLADIALKHIKVVVVYKVDRLTRSLADFAKLVELFDAHGVSFVSVTQQFNTTSSMGRLTLNVLLSFAQFAVYIGRISHKGEVHQGQYQGIVDEDVWNAVQVRLAKNAQTYSERSNAADPSLLAGMLFDSEGRRLQPTHAKKGGKRYRYYYHRAEPGAADAKVPRIPASELERVVLNEMARFLGDEQRLLAALPQLNAAKTKSVLDAAASNAHVLAGASASERIRVLKRFVARVTVGKSSLEIGVLAAALCDMKPGQEPVVHVITVPVRLKRGGLAMRLVAGERTNEVATPDRGLVALLTSRLLKFTSRHC